MANTNSPVCYEGTKLITKRQIAFVLRAYKSGDSRHQIADSLQISYQAVSRVVRSRSTEGFVQRGHTEKMLRHHVALLRNRVRKLERLLKVSAHVIRRVQPNVRKRAQLGTAVQARFQLSRLETNRVVGVASAVSNTKLNRDAHDAIVADMQRYFQQNPGQGFLKVFGALLEGQPYSKGQLKRIYESAKLGLANRSRRIAEKVPVPARIKRPMQVQTALNDMWSMDYLTHVTTRGERFWVLNIVDDFNREALATQTTRHRTTKMVVECLKRLQENGRTPKAIRSDNAAEFKGGDYVSWAKRAGVKRVYIRPSSPTENVLVERFNRTMRQEVLDRYLLTSIVEAGRMLEDWRVRYNLARPHLSLGGLAPLQFSALVK